MNRKEAIIYLAAMIDGEGSISLSKKEKSRTCSKIKIWKAKYTYFEERNKIKKEDLQKVKSTKSKR